jgi:hypothetical protein
MGLFKKIIMKRKLLLKEKIWSFLEFPEASFGVLILFCSHRLKHGSQVLCPPNHPY